MATKPIFDANDSNDYQENMLSDNERLEEKEREEVKEKEKKIRKEILAEIKDELLTEMHSKNKELLTEINKLKTELRDLSTKKGRNKDKKDKKKNNKKKSKKSKQKKHRAAESLHNEWPKLNVKDRASLRRKLAKEIEQHHNVREKKKFKLEKSLIKKEKKLEKYKREIFKLEAQLKKHGVKYVGPPEEDRIYGLLCCLKYKSILHDEMLYERRYSISHSAVKLEERQVQRKWAELFTDLIFVAIIVKFASQINSQYIYYSKLGDTLNMFYTLLNGLLFFIPFWCLWLELTVTLIRFHDFEGKWYGLVDDTLIFIILAGVIEISFQIDINADLFETQYANRFLLGFGLCIIALLLLHIFYRWKLKATAARYCRRRIYSYSAALFILFLPAIDINNPLYIIFSVISSCAIMLYVSLVSFRVHPLSATNAAHHHHHHHHHKHHKLEAMYSIYCLESIVERFGIFSMIVIGESILALLISPDPGSFIRYICVYFAFALLYLFQLMYFSSHAQEACHALNKLSSPGAVAWILWHLPLSSSLLFVGIGLRLLVTFADLDSIPPQISIVLVTGTCATICNYYILRLCHDKFQLFQPISICLRALPIIICPACLLIEPALDSFGVILWCFVITISSCFFDMILINQYEIKPIWLQSDHHHTDDHHGDDDHHDDHHQHHAHHYGEFEFHPEEYNPIYLPFDSWLFCRNYDGEHGRTMVVTLAEYIIDDETLQTIHEIEESQSRKAADDHHNLTVDVTHAVGAAAPSATDSPVPGIHIAHNFELPKSPMANLSSLLWQSHKHKRRNSSISDRVPDNELEEEEEDEEEGKVAENPSVIIHKTPEPIAPITPFETITDNPYEKIFPIKMAEQKTTTALHPPSSRTASVNKNSSLSNLKQTHPFQMTRSQSHEPDNAAIIDWESWVHEIEAEQEEEHEHRHQWLSEFADLVFVAIIINFADQIKYRMIGECVAEGQTANDIVDSCLVRLFSEAAIYFFAFFTVWYELSVTLIRFTEIEGVADDILKFVYLGGVVTMTLQMSKDEFLSANIGGFITGIIVCLLCMTLLHIIYYFNIENCQLYARKRIALYFVAITVLFASSISDSIFISQVCIVAVSVCILWISSNSFRVILTPNDELLELPQDVFEHSVERFGVFVMIATGESILALIATTNKLSPGSDESDDIAFQHYIAILCAFGITYLVSHYYLESSKINSMHFHALMHPGSPGSVLWTLLHGLLAFFLMLVGAGWKLLLLSLSLEICWIDAEKYYIYNTKQSAQYVQSLKYKCCDKYHIQGDCLQYGGLGWIQFSLILGTSLTASLITMYLLRTSHPKFIFSWKSILCRFPIIFIIPCGAYWTNQFQTQSFYYSVWCLILMTISYFVDHLFIDIYQSDIKPELRTFYNAQIAPQLRQQTLQLHLMESKRKSLEFGRSASLSNLTHKTI